MNPEIKITGKQIRNQLKADLIGKDSYRGITLTYAWLANQFGHFALGFIPTIILHAGFNKYLGINNPSMKAALFWGLACLIFETWNFLGPLWIKKKTNWRWIYLPNKTNYTFQPPWGNVAFDTITDLGYFWLGCLSASEFILNDAIKIELALIIIVILFFCFLHWYKVKMYLQAAYFPFQFRLSQWSFNIQPMDKELIKTLHEQKEDFHLLLCGHNHCGRTSLAVAIATEYSMQKKTVLYTTAMKLLPLFYEEISQHPNRKHQLWNWMNTSLLVIDDINPSTPVFKEVIDTNLFLKCIDTNKESNELNRHLLKNKKAIWVLGIDEEGNHFDDSWKAMLLKVGVPENSIHVINLSDCN